MAPPAPAVAPTLELEDPQLGPAQMLDHLGGEGGTLYVGLPHRDPVAVAHHEDLVEAERLAGLAGKTRNRDHLVGSELGLDAVDVGDHVHPVSP